MKRIRAAAFALLLLPAAACVRPDGSVDLVGTGFLVAGTGAVLNHAAPCVPAPPTPAPYLPGAYSGYLGGGPYGGGAWGAGYQPPYRAWGR